MKKLFTIFIILFLITSCSKNKVNNTNNENVSAIETQNNIEKEIKITTTIFPIYDYVKVIMGDTFVDKNVRLLIDSGLDLHNYQLNTKDISDILNSDLFIYIGGESDKKWTEKLLSNNKNEKLKSISLVEILGDKVKTEEEKEGMTEDEHEEETHQIDEHVWLSLKNSKIFVREIAKLLSEIDENKSEIYQKNADDYIKKLDDLDKEYEDILKDEKTNTLVFADRFPFRYLFDDYNIDYFAAFKGCASETEASFETMTFLTNKVDELNLNYVMKLIGSKDNMAKTIISNSNNKNRQILEMSSVENVYKDDIAKNVSYLSIMNQNKEVLKKALEN